MRRAAVAAGVAPREFAREALGTGYRDADSSASPMALHRLALLTGQRRDHLVAGTLRLDVEVVQDTAAGMAEDALLRHGRLLLLTDPLTAQAQAQARRRG